MLVSIRFLCFRFQEMHMTPAANVDCAAGLTFERMVMSIGKICAEAYLVYMVVAARRDCFAAYGCKAMVVRFVAAAFDLYTANNFMHMLLPAAVAIAPIRTGIAAATAAAPTCVGIAAATAAAIPTTEGKRDVVLAVNSAL